MMHKKLWVIAIILAGSAAFGLGLDSPDGEPPHGLVFETGRSGTQLEGFAAVLFQGVTTDAKAVRYDAVVRLRKGGDLHAYHSAYTCSGPDTCSICDGSFIDISLVTAIQFCIENQIQADVLADFAPDAADLRLRDVADTVSEPLGSELVVASDVSFTAK